jgi:hypothetical protein
MTSSNTIVELREAAYELVSALMEHDPAFLAQISVMSLVILRHQAPDSYNPINAAKAILEWSPPPTGPVVDVIERNRVLHS